MIQILVSNSLSLSLGNNSKSWGSRRRLLVVMLRYELLPVLTVSLVTQLFQLMDGAGIPAQHCITGLSPQNLVNRTNLVHTLS